MAHTEHSSIGTIVNWGGTALAGGAAGIRSVDEGDRSVDLIRAKDLGGGLEKIFPAARNAQRITVVYEHDPDDTSISGLEADLAAKTGRALVVVQITGTLKTRTWSNAYVESISGPRADQGDILVSTVVFQATTDPVDS